MMTINKSKVIIISIFIIIFFGGSIVHIQEASAEMKKVYGTSQLLRRLVTDDNNYDQTRFRLINNIQLYSSADPDWNKAKVFSIYYYINPTRDGDPYNGLLAITHHNGDQTFVKYDGSWKWALPKDGYSWISESKGRFTGGTGKFEGISGTITIKVEGSGQSYISSKWETEYEIK
jgi:hypothetical protein